LLITTQDYVLGYFRRPYGTKCRGSHADSLAPEEPAVSEGIDGCPRFA
jgi:hypothetical protein